LTDLVLEYKEFVIPVFTALLMGIGFLLKEIFQRKKNKKTALFILLEIWYKSTVFLLEKPDKHLFNEFNRVSKKFNISFTDDEKKDLAKQISKIMMQSIESSSLDDIDNYEKKFNEAITLIASEDPIFAHKINNIGYIKAIKSFTNNYEELVSQNFDTMILNNSIYIELKEINEEEDKFISLNNLELAIKSLALKISLLTYFKILYYIYSRKKSIKEISIEILKEEEELIDHLLISYLHNIKEQMKNIDLNKLEKTFDEEINKTA